MLDYLTITFEEQSAPYWMNDTDAVCNMIPDKRNAGRTIVNIGGKALQTLRDEGMLDKDILKHLTENDYNISRLDYALDSADPSANIRELYEMSLDKAKHQTMYVEGNKGGETLYIGAPSSARRIRIYDKAAELKILSKAITRVELQQRTAKKCARLAAAMLEHGERQAVQAVLRRALDKYLSAKWLYELLAGEHIPYHRETPDPDGWLTWMESKVMPSIEKHIHSHPNEIAEYALRMISMLEQSTRLLPDEN